MDEVYPYYYERREEGDALKQSRDDLEISIAKMLFDIWKEAKSTEEDNWDDVSFDSLPDKHKHEYLKTSKRIIVLVELSL